MNILGISKEAYDAAARERRRKRVKHVGIVVCFGDDTGIDAPATGNYLVLKPGIR